RAASCVSSPRCYWRFGSERGVGTGALRIGWFSTPTDLESPCGGRPYALVRAAGGLAGDQRARHRRRTCRGRGRTRRGEERPAVVFGLRATGVGEGASAGGAGRSAVLRAAGPAGVAQAPLALP